MNFVMVTKLFFTKFFFHYKMQNFTKVLYYENLELYGTHLWVTATNFVISVHIDDLEAIQMCSEQPFNKRLLHYRLSKPS